MTWTEDDQREVGLALARAELALYKNRKVLGSDVVFEVVKNIADIERRMQVGATRPKSEGFSWEYNHSDLTPDDVADIKKFRDVEIAAGDPWDVVYGIILTATPDEQDHMDAVIRVFQSCLIGKTKEIKIRDWKLIYMLAQGRTVPFVARKVHLSKRRVIDRKSVQCGVIWKAVRHLMPTAVSGLQAAA